MPKKTEKKRNLIDTDDAFMRREDVLAIYPVSSDTWENGVRDGMYPRPVRLSKRLLGWRVRDIKQLLKDVGQSHGA